MSLRLLTPEQIDALTSLSAPELRKKLYVFREDALSKLPPAPVDEPAKIEDSSFKGPESEIPIRIFTPDGTGPFPVVVHFHGGGWVLGDLDSHDGICRYMCVSTGAVVIAIDYRLSPEAKFPAATEDCYAAVVHVHSNAEKYNIDPERIAVAGDSAGGNLSAVACLMSRDRQGPKIKFQCLIYPATDFTADGPHKQANPSAVLIPQITKYFGDAYLNGPEDMEHPYCSPMKADLSGLPPAFLLTCELDTLLEEGADYVRKLNEAGVPCEYVNAPGLDHGFFGTNRHHLPAVGPFQQAAFASIKKALFN